MAPAARSWMFLSTIFCSRCSLKVCKSCRNHRPLLVFAHNRHLSARAGVLALCNPRRSPATPAVAISLQPWSGPKSTISGRILFIHLDMFSHLRQVDLLPAGPVEFQLAIPEICRIDVNGYQQRMSIPTLSSKRQFYTRDPSHKPCRRLKLPPSTAASTAGSSPSRRTLRSSADGLPKGKSDPNRSRR